MLWYNHANQTQYTRTHYVQYKITKSQDIRRKKITLPTRPPAIRRGASKKKGRSSTNSLPSRAGNRRCWQKKQGKRPKHLFPPKKNTTRWTGKKKNWKIEPPPKVNKTRASPTWIEKLLTPVLRTQMSGKLPVPITRCHPPTIFSTTCNRHLKRTTPRRPNQQRHKNEEKLSISSTPLLRRQVRGELSKPRSHQPTIVLPEQVTVLVDGGERGALVFGEYHLDGARP